MILQFQFSADKQATIVRTKSLVKWISITYSFSFKAVGVGNVMDFRHEFERLLVHIHSFDGVSKRDFRIVVVPVKDCACQSQLKIFWIGIWL